MKVNFRFPLFRLKKVITRRTSRLRVLPTSIEKEALRLHIEKRLAFFNRTYGFTYRRITIRNQRTRWGSASRLGNLNFNYRMTLLPPHLSDYIIVHELCHLGAFNHSKKFWELVARTIPDYRACRQQLRAIKVR